MNTPAARARLTLAGSFVAALMLLAAPTAAENTTMPSIDLPNPYAVGVKFGQLPEGRQWSDRRRAGPRWQEHLGF
jgi:hypothetical protein